MVSLRGRLVRCYITGKVKKIQNEKIHNNIPSKEAVYYQPPQGFSFDDTQKLVLLYSEKGMPDKAILQMHGGGFFKPLDSSHRKNSVWYAKLSGCGLVAAPDYRCAPLNPFPAALEDVIEAWNTLVNMGYAPENIALAGDSAGGNLALSLAMHLRNEKCKGPCAIYLCSPWLDLACEGESYRTKKLLDPIFGAAGSLSADAYADCSLWMEPAVSPLYGSFEGLPPVLIQAGTHEILLSDSLAAARKAKEAGVNCTLTIYEGMFHGFQYAYALVPEAKQAWREAGDFLKKYLCGH